MRKWYIVILVLSLVMLCSCASNKDETTASLIMPDYVEFDNRGSCFDGGVLRVTQKDDTTLLYSHTDGDDVQTETERRLTTKEIERLNGLYLAIDDFSNVPLVEDRAWDTVIGCDGERHQLCRILTESVELEQYLNLLVWDGDFDTYDGSVMQYGETEVSWLEERGYEVSPERCVELNADRGWQ